MKKIYLAASLLLFTVFSFAQKQDSTKRDTLISGPLPPASNPNKYTPNLVLPSPHAATLGNYGNVLINLSSGLPSPNISLFDLKEGDIELGIGLSYQYRGFKPFESPSLLGRGWGLNAGGVVTRVIRSRPDEKSNTSTGIYGYASAQNRTNLANLINSDGTIVGSGGQQALAYTFSDGEPDIFIFNFMGMTGKFFFGEDGTIHIVSDRKIKIEYRIVTLTSPIGNNLNSDLQHFVEFTITDENGTVYRFGDTSTTVVLPFKNVEFSSSGSDFDCPEGNKNVTSWFLGEVTDKNGRKINFNYTNDYLTQSGSNFNFNYTLRGRNVTSPVTRGQYQSSTQTYSHDNMWSCVGSLENFLTSVSGTNWKVNFEYNKTGNVTYLTKTILSANTSPSQDIKKFTFDYANLDNPDGLLLSTVTESSPDNSISKQHLFTYNDPNNLYYQLPYAIDYLGFDNGASTNTSLIADAPFNANRSPNFTTTLKGALTKMVFPTSGSTEFAYEQNEYGQIRESEYENSVLINKKSYPGIRVKTITDKDIDGSVLSQRNISYDSFTNASKSSGFISSTIGLTKIISNGVFTSSESVAPTFPTLSNGTIYFSEGLHSIAEIPIYYTNVTETLSDGANTKTEFTSHNDYNDYLGINFGRGNNQIGSPASYLLMRSLPKSVRHYKNNTLVKEKINIYNLVDRHKARSLYTGGITAGSVPTTDLLKTYYTYSGWLQKTSEIERLYAGSTEFIETVNNLSYNNSTFLQVSSITTQSSKGETLLMNYKYPFDFSTEPYLTMTSKNIIAPVIEETSFLNATQTASKITDYAIFGTLQMPQKIRTKIGSGMEITPITFDTYDTRGNLTKYTTRNALTATMQYFGTTDLGKTDLLKSKTVGGGSIGTDLDRTMSYDYFPLVGLSFETDINGYTTTFLYDVFNRLKSVKDTQNYGLKDLNYHYANQAALSGLGVTPTNAMNYVISRTARIEQTGTALDSDIEKTTTQLEYMDGLGRNVQSLIWKGSPDKLKDIITGNTQFDLNGRPYKSLLPTPSDAITGAYKSTAQTLASAFYDGDTYPYTETVFENSPLNRPLKQFGAGQAWRTADKYISIQYLLAGNFIVQFDVQGNGTVNGANAYGNSTLYKNCVLSERGYQSYEIKDKEGRVTHKFQQMDAGFAVTAYVYNDLRQLAYVIPPEIYEKIRVGTITSFTENDVVFKESIYGYHYDDLGRQNEKHIPGAGWTYFVFDKQDRIVYFADDSDKAKDYWQWIKYDALSRKIQSGIQKGNGIVNRAALQTAFDGITTEIYEERGTALLGYTNRSFPVGYEIGDADVMQVIYYDDFLWNTDYNYNFQSANAFHAQGLTKGLMTGMLVRNIETNAWYKSLNYFDYKSRPIQSFSQNHLGGIDRSEYQYRFNGEVLKMRMVHQKTGLADFPELYEYAYDHYGRKTSFTHNSQVVARYEYDDIGRLQTKKFKPMGISQSSLQTGNWTDVSSWSSGILPISNDNVTINSGHTLTIPAGQIASAGTLNDEGTLENFGTLNMGKIPNADLYAETFKYHIRGGLRGINLDANNDLTNSLFSFKLTYEEGNDGYFDGNIRNQYWKSNLDGVQRTYQYSYDAASRIIQGNYASTNTLENYTLNSVTYDLNGNIKTLSRNGYKSNNSLGLIDDLNYTYQINSNKIQKVDDISGETASFTDATGSTDYTYSSDGSLISDANKGITLIEYNYLKLPRSVVQNGVTTLIQYDASGRKLKETIGTNFTDYSGNKIYKNNSLYQISHDEGRIIDGEYEYNIKDHLGNLRVAFRDSLGIAKISQHYAYGVWGEELTTLSYLKQTWKADNFKFTGKESLQGTGFIDFGARWYDNIVPRFTTIDPLSELSRRFSPTIYGSNNPLRFIDPDGMRAVWNGKYGSESGYNDNETGESRSWGQVQGEYYLGGDDKDKGKKGEAQTNNGQQESTTNGFTYGIGDGLNFLGDNSISTRGKFNGSTEGTSIASQYFRQRFGSRETPRWLFKNLPKRVGLPNNLRYSMAIRSNNLGAVLGRTVPLLGRGFIGVSAGMSIYNVANSENKAQAITREGGGWAVAYAGAEGGAYIGGGIGAWFGGVGAAPGAVIGGIIGGGIGYFAGAEAGEAIYNKTKE